MVCGAMIWTGFAAPAMTTPIYDVLAAAQTGDTQPTATSDEQSVELSETFWRAFADVLTGPEAGYDAGSITAAVASLGGAVDAGFGDLAEAAARAHPGSAGACDKPAPDRLSLDTLARCPDDSLARDLHRMLVDNGYDPEVLDRDAIGLAELPSALRYFNTRILSMHDIWHLVAGYETTALHEIAISAFQLAQFGHNYSGMFLAVIATRSHLGGGLGFELLMQTICEAWRHGRQTPPLMAIEFEDAWHDSIDVVRERFSIEPFVGSFPADLFEQMAGAQSPGS